MENYEIIANIGKGSSGAVFLAKHVRDKKLVAIKKIEIDENRRSRCKKSVVREAAILRRLSHPYIVECEEWFLDGEEKVMHIVLEFCNGGTMQDLVRQTRNKKTFFPEEKVLKWLAHVVSAVAYMHSKKILHRDLKTENVFVVKPDIAKLGDFGISKEIDHTLDMAQTCVGTPCYLSPELCQDIPYSSKSDVWALGCLLFEMAALKPAFDAANLVSLFYKIVKGDFADLPEHCSTDMLDIVNAILQKNPEDRPSAARLLEHPALVKYVSQLRSDALPKIGRKSAGAWVKNSPERKRPPKLAELKEKSGNVDKLTSLENSNTITNDDMERTIDGSGPLYAYNMFLSESTRESTVAPTANRAVSVLEVGAGGKGGPSAVPKLFAYQARPHVGTGSPPPQEVDTARPQTCPHSASETRTAPVEEENFTDTVVTWSGYGDRGSRHRSGRRRSDSISLSSGTDESSDSDADNRNRRRRIRNGRWRDAADSEHSYSGDEDISEELVREEPLADDDIPEVIEANCSGDSAHTGDEQSAGDSGRLLPGSAWLRSKRAQVLQRQQSGTNFEKNNNSNNNHHRKKKTRLPGSSWLSKQQRAERENANRDAEPIVLGQNNHIDGRSKHRGKESKHDEKYSGKIRNLPGSAWLKNAPSKITTTKNEITTSVPQPNHRGIVKEPSMVLENFSSGSANEFSSPEKGKSDTDAEYDSDCSYPDDFEDYEDDFELSEDDFSDDDRNTRIQGKSSLNVVRQGCIDALGKDVFDELVNYFNKGLTFSEALCKFNTKKVDEEALEACYLLLHNNR